jgi:membrane protein
VVVLVWVYYAGLIFFFGAEFTQVYANTYGTGVKPRKEAMAVEDKTGRVKDEGHNAQEPWAHRQRAEANSRSPSHTKPQAPQ